MNIRHNPLLLFSFCVLIFTSVLTKAQSVERQVIASSGDYHFNSISQVEWTLGEISTEYYSSSSVTLGQGFNQIYVEMIGMSETKPEYQVRVYPNPTKKGVFIEGNDLSLIQSVNIHDIHGKLLKGYQLNSSSEEQIIDIEFLPTGIYIMNLLSNGTGIVKSFKIIKE